jgi:hypothetical protein
LTGIYSISKKEELKMILDTGSLMFNMDLTIQGGNPSWGTEMGQGVGHKFNFENADSFFEGMVFKSVSDIKSVTDVVCPLGKGGAQQENYEYVMASLFDKVYANETLIPDAQFLLLIVKRINGETEVHIGRRTLKYSPKMTYKGKEINQDCFDKIVQQLGMTGKSAWFINSIDIKNQDELHLGVYIAGDNPMSFADVYQRKDFVNRLIRGASIPDYNALGNEERKKAFKNWLTKQGVSSSLVSHYPSYIDDFVSQVAGKNAYGITDLQEIDKIYELIKSNPDYKSKDDGTNRGYSSAVKNYRAFIDELLHGIKTNSPTDSDESSNPKNLVIYGTPGCGKSYYVEKQLVPSLGIAKDNVVRTTFFPDYTNVDFVGQVLPKVDGENVTYRFNPGPFTLALEKALSTTEPVALIIEELNRGNAASIFGDIFQLLDRDESSVSRYGITNVNIQDYLNDVFEESGRAFSEIKIPSNLYLIATMNTSDQNVFKLDNAFKRRWEFQKMRNSFSAQHAYKEYLVPGMEGQNVTWEELVLAVNEYILSQGDIFQSEDKQLGVYFVDKGSLIEKSVSVSTPEKAEKVQKFGAKVLEYLWDDVAKYDRDSWFGDAKSLDALIDEYAQKGEEAFSKDFKAILDKYKAQEASAPVAKEPDGNGSKN